MHLDKTWWVKKNPTLYLLDIALLLALCQQINVNNHYLHLPRDYLQDDTRQGLELQFLQQANALPDLARTFKIDGLWKQPFCNHHDANKNFYDYTGNPEWNVTVNMVLVTPMEREENISIAEHSSFSDSNFNSDQDFFHFEETFRQNNNSASEFVSGSNNFNEADDVRWRQYLNIEDDTQSISRHCENNHTRNDDLYSLSSYVKEEGLSIGSINHDSSDIVGCSSSAKASPDMSFYYHDMLNHMNKNQEESDSAMSSSKILTLQSPTLNAHNAEDADLMQMLYEQDVDLGYNWQNNDPVKQLKDPNDVSIMKTDSLNLNDFSIDGETGELIPISRNTNQQMQNEAPRLHQLPPQLPFGNNSSEASNTSLDIEECLEILENSIDDMRPSKPVSQKSIDECNNMVQNLTSFIDVPGNATAQTDPSPCLWQQIEQLSDLTNLNLREDNQQVASPPRNEINGTLSFNSQAPIPAVRQQNINDQFGFAPSQYNTVGQPLNSSMFEPSLPQSYPVLGFAGNDSSSPIQQTSYLPAPITSDDGIPMDTSYVPINSSEKQESNYSGDAFNNFNYQIESSPGSNPAPIVSSLPEPGQSFFDYLSPEDGVHGFTNSSSSSSSFQPQSGASFLNPPVSNFSPPPLNQSPSASVLLDELDHRFGSVEKSGVVESYESDSGISLDQSPQGIDFLTLKPDEEPPFADENEFVSNLKTEPLTSDQGFTISELKAVQHNHTYNGTVGAPKQLKRKIDKSLSSRESRDEKKARELNLPFTLNEIILSPVEEYNEMLARTPLNPAQQALVKDIRRRGKNKVAAQNCRKRKIETISNMEEDVEVMRSKKQQLVDEQKELEIQYESVKLQYSALYQQIFSALRDDAGRPYDPDHFRLEQVEGAVFLVPQQRRDGQGTSSNGELDYLKVKQERS